MNNSNKPPNCYLCKWLAIIFFERFCAAQGYKETCDVYNNDLCKKLYDEKDEEISQRGEDS